MKSFIAEGFRRQYRKLPQETKKQARKAYRKSLAGPTNPGLQFKKVHPTKPIYSARVLRGYHAIGVISDDRIIWFWISSHADYDRLLSRGTTKKLSGQMKRAGLCRRVLQTRRLREAKTHKWVGA